MRDILWNPRRPAERVTRQRAHQPAFRARVISAYETKCAICRLGSSQEPEYRWTANYFLGR